MRAFDAWLVRVSTTEVRPSPPIGVSVDLVRAVIPWGLERGLAIAATGRMPRDGEPEASMVFDICMSALREGQLIPESQVSEFLDWLRQWAEPRGLDLQGGFEEYPRIEPDNS